MVHEAPAIYIGEPGDWAPTVNFRFIEHQTPQAEASKSTWERTLQQAWHNSRTDEIEWRDVPLKEG